LRASISLSSTRPVRPQSDRTGSIAEVFDRVYLDLVEHEGKSWRTRAIVMATLANEPLVVVSRIESDRYVAEPSFPSRR
jgi:hypothetical protein